MLQAANPVLDVAFDVHPDPDEFIRAAMDWHFNPRTGSRFWLERAGSFEFDPRTDINSFSDLTLFPNVTDELEFFGEFLQSLEQPGANLARHFLSALGNVRADGDDLCAATLIFGDQRFQVAQILETDRTMEPAIKGYQRKSLRRVGSKVKVAMSKGRHAQFGNRSTR